MGITVKVDTSTAAVAALPTNESEDIRFNVIVSAAHDLNHRGHG